jgi:hypothetical protein
MTPQRSIAPLCWFPVAIRVAAWDGCFVASTLVPAPPAPPPVRSRRRRVLARVFDALALSGATLAREAPPRPAAPRRRGRFSR